MFWCAYSLLGVAAGKVDCYIEMSVDEAVVPGFSGILFGKPVSHEV